VVVERKNRAGMVVETKKTTYKFIAGQQRHRPAASASRSLVAFAQT
jgi:hypothetical protein